MKQIICNIATLIMILILAWILLSYINVIMHNTQIGYTLPVWYVFTDITSGRNANGKRLLSSRWLHGTFKRKVSAFRDRTGVL